MWSSLLFLFSYFYATNRIDSIRLQADSAEKNGSYMHYPYQYVIQ